MTLSKIFGFSKEHQKPSAVFPPKQASLGLFFGFAPYSRMPYPVILETGTTFEA
jgi:hypothetical protein